MVVYPHVSRSSFQPDGFLLLDLHFGGRLLHRTLLVRRNLLSWDLFLLFIDFQVRSAQFIPHVLSLVLFNHAELINRSLAHFNGLIVDPVALVDDLVAIFFIQGQSFENSPSMFQVVLEIPNVLDFLPVSLFAKSAFLIVSKLTAI